MIKVVLGLEIINILFIFPRTVDACFACYEKLKAYKNLGNPSV